MTQASIPVDLFNPGQVIACLGFAEAALQLTGYAAGNFDWTAPSPEFCLTAEGDENPFRLVLDFLARAQVAALTPPGSNLSKGELVVPTKPSADGGSFPVAPPGTPATLPAILSDPQSGKTLLVTYWGDDRTQTGRDNAKFWAGLRGLPGAALVRDALALIGPRAAQALGDPFSVAAPQSSSFRLDWRRDYVPLDAGFSPNEHRSSMVMLGFPVVELLGAIGLTHARPEMKNKLSYRYSVPHSPAGPLHLMFLRAAIGAAQLPIPQRFFRMRLAWPGQENQARCITDVTEE